MNTEFEDPTKTALRRRCETAVDQAGHDRDEDLTLINLPPDAGVHSRLKGDLQSTDKRGKRFCYYLRPNAEESVPQWLATLATLAHQLDGVCVYVVVDGSPSDAFVKSCEVAGAGLLSIDPSDQFQLVLDFDTTLPVAVEKDLAEELKLLRRSMETKLELRTSELTAQSQKIGELTKDMTPGKAAKYRHHVESSYQSWTEWGENVSARLDALTVTKDRDEIEHVRAAIEIGVVEAPPE